MGRKRVEGGSGERIHDWRDCGLGWAGRGRRGRGKGGRPWETMIFGNDAVKVGQLGPRGGEVTEFDLG